MDSINIPQGAATILSILTRNGFEAYVVGGCVRDSLLGLVPKDWDICTCARPEETKRCLGEHGIRTIDTGLKHGTVTADLRERGQYEITTFRTDGTYSDSRHPDRVEFVASVVQDLSRRDFTVNAMAYSGEAGLIDPFHGRDALRRRVICCVGDPARRFHEDALRVMRALRFASVYGFSIAPDTADAIHKSAPMLNNIAAERLNCELCRLLCGSGVLPVLLDYSDVMAVIIPELGPCIGFAQNSRYHIYTVYDHIAHAAAAYTGDDIAVKMALLLHDIGKPLCCTEDERGGHFYGHAALSHAIAQSVAERLRFDNKTKAEILELVLYHDTLIEPTPKAVRRWLSKLGPERFRQLLAVKTADTRAQAAEFQAARIEQHRRLGELMREVIEKEQCFSLRDMKVSGRDIIALGVPQGAQVGRVLNSLLNEVILGTLENDRELLLHRAAALISSGSSVF